MSDSFADLWNSAAPSKPAEAPKKLGALSSATSNTPPYNGAARKPTNDVFSLLASSASGPASRSVTPGYTGNTPPQSVANTGGAPRVGLNVPVQKAPSSGKGGGGGDAFSGLLSGNFGLGNSGPGNRANMTIAQRAAQVERQRSEQLLQQQQKEKQASAAWDGLGTLGVSSSSSSRTSPAPPLAVKDDDWGLDFAAPVAPAARASSGASQSARPSSQKSALVDDDGDDWGFGEFSSAQVPPVKATPAVATTAQKSSPGLLWDLDEFSSPVAPPQPASKGRETESPAYRSGTPGSFDFGDREDGLLGDRSDDEDDILGDLGKPIDQAQPKRPSATPSPQPPTSGQRSRAVSPPPHIIGQIVEMGFSPQQARVALAATDTGLDVQAALETLLANGAASDSPPPSRPPPRQRGPTGERNRERNRYDDEHDDEDVLPRHRPPRGDPAAATASRARDQERDPPAPGGGNETQRNLQDQADKIIAQASEIGMTMFTRANAFWKQGKEKVQQVYEEQKAARAVTTTGSSAGPPKDGRPKWMQEAPERKGEREHDDGWGDPRSGGGFRDDDEEEVLPTNPSERRPPAAKPKPQPPREAEPPSAVVKTGNLLSDDAPTAYVSPWRRKAMTRAEVLAQSSKPTPTPTTTQTLPAPNVSPARGPSPIQFTQRNAISASASAIASSAKNKAAGSEMFKLGRYAEAETSYSNAISSLPDSHLLLVPLYNNRALTKIKSGDHTGAIEDCTTVITIIGASYHPQREAKVIKEDEGASVDLADGLVKAYRRRAEAYEGKEKWEAARSDWEVIAGKEWAGKVRNEAVRGAGRCRRMVSAGNDGPGEATIASPPSRPKPKPRPVQRGPTPPSEALNRVREANKAADAEDQMKHELKDSVDAKLLAWKNGKETNIRALIASLDSVLWPELGWQKVGMHEVISPNQVKIRYTKAIAKLHPDKLNVNNTTLEQRMIANGVFGSLNEAWNAFKP